MTERQIAIAANAIMDERDRITHQYLSTVVNGKHTFPWCLRDEFAIRCAEAAMTAICVDGETVKERDRVELR